MLNTLSTKQNRFKQKFSSYIDIAGANPLTVVPGNSADNILTTSLLLVYILTKYSNSTVLRFEIKKICQIPKIN